MTRPQGGPGVGKLIGTESGCVDNWGPQRVMREMDHREEHAQVEGERQALSATLAESWRGRCPLPMPAPSPAAIDRMLETMRWMLWLEVEQRHLLWMRAAQYDWQEIARRFGCCRTTAWRRWKIAINQIALHLNSEKTSKQKGHAG